MRRSAVLLAAPLLVLAGPEHDAFALLQSRCHACHGSALQSGRLRLDSRAAILAGGISGPAASPGNSGASLLIKRIESGEMPPGPAKLDPAGVALLRRWIEDGAAFPEGAGARDASIAKHWSYIAPRKAAVPTGTHPVDHFVRARLSAAGLSPAPEAPRETLLRRLSLDLTGLPPTLAEIDAFLADRSPAAYEKQVDRLLRSPHFGERWAQWWLDLARYADTNGYESDEPRSNWPWRDWVIGAFNRNLPFDQFTIEQLAGDLLPGRTEQQLIATGFHRNTLVNSEAGSKDDEFRDAAVKDRVETTATVWLGSTIGCAQCHNHKYDPFTLRDFYRFYAFFHSTAESAIQVDEEHTVFHGDRARLDRLRAAVEPLRKILDTPTPALADAQGKWEASMRARRPAVEASWREIARSAEQTVELRDPPPFTALRFESKADVEVDAWSAADLAAEAARKSNEPDWGDWHEAGPFEADSPELAHATPWPPERAPVALDASWRKRADLPDGAFRQLDGYNCSVYLYRAITTREARRIRVAVASGQGVKVFLNGRQVFASGALEPVEPENGRLTLDLRAGENQLLLKYTNGPGYYRFYFKRAAEDDRRVRPALTSPDGRTLLFAAPVRAALVKLRWKQKPKEETAVRASALPSAELADFVRMPDGLTGDELARHHRWNSPLLAKVRAEHDRRKAEADGYFAKNSAKTLVMRELAQPRETWIQQRGNFLSKVERVEPGTPAILPPLPPGKPDRLALARWLMARENPLTARVLANHVWRALFGAGLVKTGEDFGAQGERPTHPELLDFTAVEWMDRNWDFQALLKWIVLSETYRQSSAADAARLAKDPDNKLLSRGARFRLPAESVRDVTLAAAGLLSAKMGGPSVFPPLPPSVFEGLFIEAGMQSWKTSTGEDRYRRGLYTFYKRAAPYPTFTMFDAPERAVCTVDRPRSNTPLQALTTLNDEAFVEAARALAARLRGATARERAVHGFRLTTSRAPSAKELQSLLTLVEKASARYAADPAAARKLSPAAPALAPWVVAANVLLNLDEAVTKE